MKILLRSTYGLYTLGFCDHDNSGPMRSDAEAGAWGKESARCRLNSLPKFSSGDGFASSRLQRFPIVEGARRVREGADSRELSQTQALDLSKLVFLFRMWNSGRLEAGPKHSSAGFGRGRRSTSFECGTQELGKLRCGFSGARVRSL
jgi:hypothetical protein